MMLNEIRSNIKNLRKQYRECLPEVGADIQTHIFLCEKRADILKKIDILYEMIDNGVYELEDDEDY